MRGRIGRVEYAPKLGKKIDLVVTDLEMPNMNGFELSRRIKDDSRFNYLPIIAVTSLAGEEDMQRGMESGIDDYQIKLDRERLLASVANYLQTNQPTAGMHAQYARGGHGEIIMSTKTETRSVRSAGEVEFVTFYVAIC